MLLSMASSWCQDTLRWTQDGSKMAWDRLKMVARWLQDASRWIKMAPICLYCNWYCYWYWYWYCYCYCYCYKLAWSWCQDGSRWPQGGSVSAGALLVLLLLVLLLGNETVASSGDDVPACGVCVLCASTIILRTTYLCSIYWLQIPYRASDCIQACATILHVFLYCAWMRITSCICRDAKS